MPANSTHPDYDASLLTWLRARDVVAGEDAVKAAGEKYLPRLDSQTDEDYSAYKTRASFFNATARTAEGYIGLIFRKEPTFKLPDDRQPANFEDGRSHLTPTLSPARRGSVSGVRRALDGFVEDADMLGTSLQSYAKNVVNEVITIGRCGTLIDWGGSGASRTGDKGHDGENRAYAVLYVAEQIINWRMERVNGRNVLSLVALAEDVTQSRKDAKDEFEIETIKQIRVLKLESLPDGDCRYVVELWQPAEKKSGRRGNNTLPGSKAEWKLVDTRIPLRLGKPLPSIPFVFHGPRNFLPDVDKSPLSDIIAINLDHYRLNADYKHGLHFTALPTAWVSGFDKGANLRIGSSTAWVAEAPGATAGFLEFQGQGLTTFERAMDRDEQLMAVLGSRMLEAQKRVGETADAIELRQSGENSVLSAIAMSVGDSLTHILRWVYWWNSTEETPEAIGDDVVLATLNTDYKTKGMTSDQITAVVSAWQANAISRETMFELFRKGEVLPAGRTNEEEQTLLSAERGMRSAEGRALPADHRSAPVLRRSGGFG